jgi:hypothetical protein
MNLPEIERVISGKGVITLPEEYSSALQILLYVQVLREALSPSRNLTWNPDKSFYAHITFCIDDFVLYTEDVNFKSQVFEVHTSQASQNLLSLICAYDGILDSFVSVGNVIGITLSRTNLIKSHPYLRSQINRIRFECFASTALKLTLKGISLDKCDPQDGTSTPPPPPPPPISLVPPDEPVQVSPPEQGEDDGGDTIPFPIDESEPPDEFPFGEECLPYRIVGVLNRVIAGNVFPTPIDITVLGIVQDVFLDTAPILGSPGGELACICGGTGSGGCVQGTRITVTAGFEPGTSWFLDSIVEA